MLKDADVQIVLSNRLVEVDSSPAFFWSCSEDSPGFCVSQLQVKQETNAHKFWWGVPTLLVSEEATYRHFKTWSLAWRGVGVMLLPLEKHSALSGVSEEYSTTGEMPGQKGDRALSTMIVQRKFWNSMLNWSGMFDMPYANLPQGSCHRDFARMQKSKYSNWNRTTLSHWWIGVDCGDVECLKELPFLSLPSWRTEIQIYQSSFTGMEPNLLKKQHGNLIQFPYIYIYIQNDIWYTYIYIYMILCN